MEDVLPHNVQPVTADKPTATEGHRVIAGLLNDPFHYFDGYVDGCEDTCCSDGSQLHKLGYVLIGLVLEHA